MSHFDEVGELPEGFELNAKSGVIASISNEDKKIYCVQFHPEVSHTEEGGKCWKISFSESVMQRKTGN
jgi:GMP synthase (glutamine-hydrolysing)